MVGVSVTPCSGMGSRPVASARKGPMGRGATDDDELLGLAEEEEGAPEVDVAAEEEEGECGQWP